MRQKAIIRVINEVKRGTNEGTGRAWQMQKITIAWQETFDDQGRTFEQIMIVKLKGEDVDRFAKQGYKQFDEIEGDLYFYVRQSGKYYENEVVMRL